MKSHFARESITVLALSLAAMSLGAQGIDRGMAEGIQKLMGSNPATVSAVDSKGPAAKAGILEGDIITALNGKDLEKPLSELAKGLKPGATLQLSVIRDLRDSIALGFLPEPLIVSLAAGTKGGKAWLGLSVTEGGGGGLFFRGQRNGADENDPNGNGGAPRLRPNNDQGGQRLQGSPPPGRNGNQAGGQPPRPFPSPKISQI